ncbi:unnamed protein product [Cladocopium goreaui]|uniref:Voltage-dependent calcium channel type A subunit alpha-1 n=1 Tax=Cladocopium goreaui TaxID=2562237 RepID=A0A9P1G772_9DINO|nr:unnamed protein product [Cladocopium goreaui]
MRCGAKLPTSEAPSLTRHELKQEIQDQLGDFRRKLLEDFSAQLQSALTTTLSQPLPRPSPFRLQVPQATVRPVRHYASDGEEEMTEVTKKGFRKNIETEFQNAMDGIIKSQSRQSRSRSRSSRSEEAAFTDSGPVEEEGQNSFAFPSILSEQAQIEAADNFSVEVAGDNTATDKVKTQLLQPLSKLKLTQRVLKLTLLTLQHPSNLLSLLQSLCSRQNTSKGEQIELARELRAAGYPDTRLDSAGTWVRVAGPSVATAAERPVAHPVVVPGTETQEVEGIDPYELEDAAWQNPSLSSRRVVLVTPNLQSSDIVNLTTRDPDTEEEGTEDPALASQRFQETGRNFIAAASAEPIEADPVPLTGLDPQEI